MVLLKELVQAQAQAQVGGVSGGWDIQTIIGGAAGGRAMVWSVECKGTGEGGVEGSSGGDKEEEEACCGSLTCWCCLH